MAEIKWIKLMADMFDNRKIKYLRKLPDGNNIVLIWVMLLTMAGRCNAGGKIFLTEDIPYTPKMLADELDFSENTVQLALGALEGLKMITTANDGAFSITGWGEYQNIEGMDKIREQNRIRKQRQRAKAALPPVDGHVTSRDSHDTDIDKDKESDIEEESLILSKDSICSTDVLRIIQAWNGLGLSQVKKIVEGTNRANMLNKRFKDYGTDTILQAIAKIQQSDFLMGKGDDGWVITFDWFIKPNNFPKVLSGNYDNNQAPPKSSAGGRKEPIPVWMDKGREDRLNQDMKWLEEFSKKQEQEQKPELSPEYQARVEALKREIHGEEQPQDASICN